MKARYAIPALAAVLLLAGCGGSSTTRTDLTPVEKRELQSRSYDQEHGTVFKATMSVLQDQGFTIQDADLETGHISASSATEQSTNIVAAFFGVPNSKATSMGVTAFVEEIQGQTAVRVSFVTRTEQFGGYGKTGERGEPVYDAQVYQRFFEALETAIFMRS